jgi:hypothetical protein
MIYIVHLTNYDEDRGEEDVWKNDDMCRWTRKKKKLFRQDQRYSE